MCIHTSGTWLLWTYGGWVLGSCPSWSQCNCQCVRKIYITTLQSTKNIKINCYLTTFVLLTIWLVLLHLKNCQKLVTCKNIWSGKRLTTLDVNSEWLLVSHSSAMPQPTVIFKDYLTSPFEADSIVRLGNSCLLTGLNLWSLLRLDIGLAYSTECLPALLLCRGWQLCL